MTNGTEQPRPAAYDHIAQALLHLAQFAIPGFFMTIGGIAISLFISGESVTLFSLLEIKYFIRGFVYTAFIYSVCNIKMLLGRNGRSVTFEDLEAGIPQAFMIGIILLVIIYAVISIYRRIYVYA